MFLQLQMMVFQKRTLMVLRMVIWINPIQNPLMGIKVLNITGFIDKTING